MHFRIRGAESHRETSHRFNIILSLAVALALGAAPALAQFRASIQGTVTDPTGAAIPGASLELTDVTNSNTQNAKSNAQGVYFFNALPSDNFRLVVRARGFASKTLTNLTIIPEQPNTLNITLVVGNASESVTVDAGEVPALDTTTANISGTITSNQIQHMPSFNRDVMRLASLAPGMFGDDSQTASGNENNLPAEQNGGVQSSTSIFGKGEITPQVVGNGGQNNTSLYVIDGIPTASASWAGSTVIIPQEDSVQYMKVSANAYDAEFGRFSGAVVQVTSNSGTNSYHGSLFFKADRPGLNAWQRWNGARFGRSANAGKNSGNRGLAKDQSRFNQFGGSVGGPLLHDKLFAFFAYETLRNNHRLPLAPACLRRPHRRLRPGRQHCAKVPESGWVMRRVPPPSSRGPAPRTSAFPMGPTATPQRREPQHRLPAQDPLGNLRYFLHKQRQSRALGVA